MKALIMVAALGLASLPLHARTVHCVVENPCGWLNPAAEGEESLGYCTGTLFGDEKVMTLNRVDGNGQALGAFNLTVGELTSERLTAASPEAELKVSYYEDESYVGILTMTEPKLGFFVSCLVRNDL